MIPIIFIAGLPGSGKTTLAKQIGTKFSLPVFHKDAIKETLFDALGYSDRAWSKKLGKASMDILYHLLEQHLKTKSPCILETNFKPELDNPRIQALHTTYPFRALQLLCYTDGAVLYERFKYRACFGNRHPGHADCDNLEEFKETLRIGKAKALDIPGELLELDTTDFTSISYDTLFEKIQNFLAV